MMTKHVNKSEVEDENFDCSSNCRSEGMTIAWRCWWHLKALKSLFKYLLFNYFTCELTFWMVKIYGSRRNIFNFHPFGQNSKPRFRIGQKREKCWSQPHFQNRSGADVDWKLTILMPKHDIIVSCLCHTACEEYKEAETADNKEKAEFVENWKRDSFFLFDKM